LSSLFDASRGVKLSSTTSVEAIKVVAAEETFDEFEQVHGKPVHGRETSTDFTELERELNPQIIVRYCTS